MTREVTGRGPSIHDFPDVAIGIFDAAAEHESMILRRIGVGASPRGRSLCERGVDRVATVGAEREKRQTLTAGRRRSGAGWTDYNGRESITPIVSENIMHDDFSPENCGFSVPPSAL